jgi:hypothetical protein
MTKKKKLGKKKNLKFNVVLNKNVSIRELFEDHDLCVEWRHDIISTFGEEFGWEDFISDEALNKFLNSLDAEDIKEATKWLEDNDLIERTTFDFEIENTIDVPLEIYVVLPDLTKIKILEVDRKTITTTISTHSGPTGERLIDSGIELKMSRDTFKNGSVPNLRITPVKCE